MGEQTNRLRLNATLLEKSTLRFTPAGVAVFEGKFRHIGQAYEAGALRRLEFDFPAIAFDSVALRLSKESTPTSIEIEGFLAPKSMKTQKLLVHITEYKI